MKRFFAGIGLVLILLAATLYITDYLVIRYRVAANRSPFGTVSVRTYYAVQEKNNKVEYIFKSQEDHNCVHSLFPHLGYPPCWYLNRHQEEQVTI